MELLQIKLKVWLLLAGAIIGVVAIIVGELMVRAREEKIRRLDALAAGKEKSVAFLSSALGEWPPAIRQTYLLLQLPGNQANAMMTANQALLDCLVNVQKALRDDFDSTVSPAPEEKLRVLEAIGLKQPGSPAIHGGILELIGGGETLIAAGRKRREDLRAELSDCSKQKEALQASCSRIRVEASAIQIFGLLVALGKDLVG